MITVTGVVLRTTDIKEADKLLSIATLEKGLITAVAKGVRKANAKLSGATGVLTFGVFSLTEGKNGYILSGVDVSENFFACWSDPLKYASALLCVEICGKFSQEETDLRSDVVDLLKALRGVNYVETYSLVYALHFFIRTSTRNGVDWHIIKEQNQGVFELIERLSTLEADDLETVDATQGQILEGVRYLSALAESELGIKLKVVGQIMRSV